MFHRQQLKPTDSTVSPQNEATTEEDVKTPEASSQKTTTASDNKGSNDMNAQNPQSPNSENTNQSSGNPAANTGFPRPGASSFGGYGNVPVGNAATGRGRKLIIGEGINLSGQIDACDHLIVEGTVEAELKGAQMLEIFESGVYYGKADIEQATIAGRFEGDITVDGRLVVKSSGIIIGNITYKELAVEAGATIEGALQPQNSVSSTSKSKTPAANFSKGKAAANKESGDLPLAANN